PYSASNPSMASQTIHRLSFIALVGVIIVYEVYNVAGQNTTCTANGKDTDPNTSTCPLHAPSCCSKTCRTGYDGKPFCCAVVGSNCTKQSTRECCSGLCDINNTNKCL